MTDQTTFETIRDALRKPGHEVTEADRATVTSFLLTNDPGLRWSASDRDPGHASFARLLNRIIDPLRLFAKGAYVAPDELAAAIAFFEHMALDDEGEPSPTQH